MLNIFRSIVALSLTLSIAHAECMDEMLLDGMTLCLTTEQGDPDGRWRVMEILNERNLLSSQQRSKFIEAFSQCVRQDARQLRTS